MKNIRSSIFETNSSSTHSITISIDIPLVLDTIEPDEDGRIILNGGKFTSYRSDINSAIDKANYYAVRCLWNKYDSEKKLERLSEIIRKQTGAKEVIYNIKFPDYYGDNDMYDDTYSEFDHDHCNIYFGSSDNESDIDEIFKLPPCNLDMLTNFIFNPKCFVSFNS